MKSRKSAIIGNKSPNELRKVLPDAKNFHADNKRQKPGRPVYLHLENHTRNWSFNYKHHLKLSKEFRISKSCKSAVDMYINLHYLSQILLPVLVIYEFNLGNINFKTWITYSFISILAKSLFMALLKCSIQAAEYCRYLNTFNGTSYLWTHEFPFQVELFLKVKFRQMPVLFRIYSNN